MDKKIRIGIFGSCLTRDVFTTFYNDYKNHFDLIFSHERQSVISLFQDSLPFDEEDIKIFPDSKKNQFRTRNIFNDLTKSFFNDLNKNIDYLIIDVYFEVLFGILILDNGSIITNNKWDLHKTNFYNNLTNFKTCNMYDNPTEYFKSWSLYCDKFFKYLEESYPNVKIILNKVHLAEIVLREDFSQYINTDFQWMVKTYSPFIKKFENYIENNYDVISIEYDDLVYTSEKNRWSPYVVHLTDEYYNFIYYSICKIAGVDEIHLLNSRLKYIENKLILHEGFNTFYIKHNKLMLDEINDLKQYKIEKEKSTGDCDDELNKLNFFKEEDFNSQDLKVKTFNKLKKYWKKINE